MRMPYGIISLNNKSKYYIKSDKSVYVFNKLYISYKWIRFQIIFFYIHRGFL